MKPLRAFVACAIVLAYSQTFGGTEPPPAAETTELNPQRFELAVESAYLFGAINPPQDYQVGAEFLTARVRWGVVQRDIWLRGYNQFYISAIAEPIFCGIENHYFGLNLGMRYNFVRPDSRFVPYFSGGLGLGWIDSQSGNSWWPGTGFYIQHFIGRRNFLSRGRSLEDKCGSALSAPLEWRANRSQSQPEPFRSTSGRELFVLIFAVMSSETETSLVSSWTRR